MILKQLYNCSYEHSNQWSYSTQGHWCWEITQSCSLYNMCMENKNKMIKLGTLKEKMVFDFLSFYLSSTCKTTVFDKTKTAAKRYTQPMIFSLSKIIFGVFTDVSWAGGVLCIRPIVTAPTTHNNVPKILTLLYKQLSLTFSNLHHDSWIDIPLKIHQQEWQLRSAKLSITSRL